MIIYPAIDLRGGKVVQLVEGDPNQQTTFSDDPIAIAEKWIEQGAEWLHIVNLDGAFGDSNQNGDILEQIAEFDIDIQFGGGLRTMDDIIEAFERGASRVILGTIAIKEPQVVADAVRQFGKEAICVALDAKNGKVTTHGWQETSEVTPIEFGQYMVELGVIHALYTDVSRDGHLQGVNVADTIALGKETGLQVIASGGVSTLEDIRQLSASEYVAGAIIGTALYTGKFTLTQALEQVGDS